MGGIGGQKRGKGSRVSLAQVQANTSAVKTQEAQMCSLSHSIIRGCLQHGWPLVCSSELKI